jgi:nondiscriminating glutamyl-tRNA synthetase
MPQPVRVRLAPSPTGNLHVGTARTGLYNQLFARKNNGAFVLRMEDTDDVRSKEEFLHDIIDGLKWLGIHWDEGPDVGGPFGPYKQSEKIDHYAKQAEHLISRGLAYFCFCSTEELDAMREEQKVLKQAPRYNNHCRNLTSHQVEQYEKEGRIPAIRFKIDEPRVVSWVDQIKGEITIDSSDLGGDLIIIKSNGIATFNFAVVVDDIDMKISHVIRGEDHIHNAAKALLLFEALDAAPPQFAHVPLMVDLAHAKLSKRKHGEAVWVSKYKADGYPPEALVNYLAQMSWTPPEGQEFFTLEEAFKMFDLHKVSKSPAVFDLKKLNWFSGHYIRALSLPEVTQRALPFLSAAQFDISSYETEKLQLIVACVKDGLSCFSQIQDAARFFFVEDVEIPAELRASELEKESATRLINHALAKLKEIDWSSAAGCKTSIEAIGKELTIKGKELYWPIRLALTGDVHGPDLGSVFYILGADRVAHRLKSALQSCSTSPAV